MFKSQGRQHFEKCVHKSFIYDATGRTEQERQRTSSRITAISLVCPQVEMSSRSVVARASERSFMVTTNDKNTDERVFLDQKCAITELGKTAASVVCETCPLYNMSSQEVTNVQIGYLDTETAKLEAQTRLLRIRQEVQKLQSPGNPTA